MIDTLWACLFHQEYGQSTPPNSSGRWITIVSKLLTLAFPRSLHRRSASCRAYACFCVIQQVLRLDGFGASGSKPMSDAGRGRKTPLLTGRFDAGNMNFSGRICIRWNRMYSGQPLSRNLLHRKCHPWIKCSRERSTSMSLQGDAIRFSQRNSAYW